LTKKRVSTSDQDLFNQKENLKRYALHEGLEITDYVEVKVSSMKKLDNRELDFLEDLKEEDVLISTETSRLSRKLSELLTIVEDLLQRKIRVIFVMQRLDLRDLDNPSTKLMLHMFSVMAEHERSVISHRTREALRSLREKGLLRYKPKGTIQSSKFDKFREKFCMFKYSIVGPVIESD
jgi:putative DNA-invertase from lambdoid prophage Rac